MMIERFIIGFVLFTLFIVLLFLAIYTLKHYKSYIRVEKEKKSYLERLEAEEEAKIIKATEELYGFIKRYK